MHSTADSASTEKSKHLRPSQVHIYWARRKTNPIAQLEKRDPSNPSNPRNPRTPRNSTRKRIPSDMYMYGVWPVPHLRCVPPHLRAHCCTTPATATKQRSHCVGFRHTCVLTAARHPQPQQTNQRICKVASLSRRNVNQIGCPQPQQNSAVASSQAHHQEQT